MFLRYTCIFPLLAKKITGIKCIYWYRMDTKDSLVSNWSCTFRLAGLRVYMNIMFHLEFAKSSRMLGNHCYLGRCRFCIGNHMARNDPQPWNTFLNIHILPLLIVYHWSTILAMSIGYRKWRIHKLNNWARELNIIHNMIKGRLQSRRQDTHHNIYSRFLHNRE